MNFVTMNMIPPPHRADPLRDFQKFAGSAGSKGLVFCSISGLGKVLHVSFCGKVGMIITNLAIWIGMLFT